MDSNFIMASMGSVVGEKKLLVYLNLRQKKIASCSFTASGGAPDARRNREFDANGENFCSCSTPF